MLGTDLRDGDLRDRDLRDGVPGDGVRREQHLAGVAAVPQLLSIF